MSFMRNENELRPYQQRIATHLYEHDEALCVVRPGGGKTAAALTAIKELLDPGLIRQALVIAPKRVARSVWPDEIAGWAHTHGLKYALVTGSPKQREKILCEARDVDLIIVGIDVVEWLIEMVSHFDDSDPIFDLLVIDEISKLRNPTGVRAKLLSKHGRRWRMRWGLTGTLRPNGPQDMFMPARVVTQGKLWGKSFYQWRQQRFYAADWNGYDWKALPGEEDKLNAEIAPLCVTLREDEYPQLPELTIVFDRVQLPPDARRTYDSMHEELAADCAAAGAVVAAANVAVCIGKLAQIANGFLYVSDEISRGPGSAAAIHDEKFEWLQDLIEDATGPTLLVYEYLHDLDMIRELLPDVPYLGAGVSDRAGMQAIADWNAGKLPFMALHPASGGHGLNLQPGGCDMAWVSPTWSPELWEQTIARLHRPGQTNPVFVRVCVAEDTVDQMKLDRVHGKMSAQAAFEKYLASRQPAE